MRFISCEFCGGPTRWTFGPGDDVWYHCINGCEAFRLSIAQMELFPGFGVEDTTRGDGRAGRALPYVEEKAQPEAELLSQSGG